MKEIKEVTKCEKIFTWKHMGIFNYIKCFSYPLGTFPCYFIKYIEV